MTTLFHGVGHDLNLYHTQGGTPCISATANKPGYVTTTWGTFDQLIRLLGQRLDQFPWSAHYVDEVTDAGLAALEGLHVPFFYNDAGQVISCPARIWGAQNV